MGQIPREPDEASGDDTDKGGQRQEARDERLENEEKRPHWQANRLPEQRERAERKHAPERRITAVEGCRSVGDGAHESLIPSTQLYAQRSRQS